MIRGFIRFVITLGVIVGLAYGGYRLVMHTMYTHTSVPIDIDADEDEYVLIEIGPGFTAGRVVEILYEKGLVRDEMIASLLVRLNGWGAIQRGEYQVNAGMSLEEMFLMFRGGDVIEQVFENFIIPEGVEIGVIANITAQALDLNSDDLMELWSDEGFLRDMISEFWFLTDEILNPDILYPLEGYFYPIRHEIPEGERDLKEVTRAMLKMTGQMLEPYRQQINAHDMTVHEILTFASIVQGETANSYEMRKVAGVFFNRLYSGNTGFRLESCVTVHYFHVHDLGHERQSHVSFEMRDRMSPFNTYQNTGLPPGPVNSPERAAIRGTLNPSEHNYYFFVGDLYNCNNGESIFAETLLQHEQNAARYVNNNGVCPTN